MPPCDEAIPGSDGEPAGLNFPAGAFIPNERHDGPKMIPIPVYIKPRGFGVVELSLKPDYAVEIGRILGPEGTVPYTGMVKGDFIVIPECEGPMELAIAVTNALSLNEYGLSWTGPTPKP